MRVCRRGLHEIPVGRNECVTCKAKRDIAHRRNYLLKGNKASSDRERYRRLYQTDPGFREREKHRVRVYYHQHRAEARRLGVSVAAHRDMTVDGTPVSYAAV